MSRPVERTRRAKLRRRAISIPALTLAAVLLTVTFPLWVVVGVVVDVVLGRWRLPLVRLVAFAWCWCWIELAGVAAAFALWVAGRSRSHPAQYALMGWWSGALMRALAVTVGMRPRIEGADALEGGNAIVLARHASVGDSLLSGWALAGELGLWPRYVLKKELLHDPCLDVVGLRVPNHFLDRGAADAADELVALRELASGVGPGIVAVIFSEGTRANTVKRERALAKIAERDADRGARLASLRRLLPPRPAGSAALVEGAPDADVVLVWHTGFDGLDSFSGMIREVARGLAPVRFVARRFDRSEVPSGAEFERWLDDRWLEMDVEVDAALGAR